MNKLIIENNEYDLIETSADSSTLRFGGKNYKINHDKPKEKDYEVLEGLASSNQILSVKRLSDGIIFKLDDLTEDGGIITKFEIKEDKILAFTETIDNDYRQRYLSSIVKEKRPLFKSHDGKGIFEGDDIFCVDQNFGITFYRNISSGFTTIEKTFFTKEEAYEYVLKNKPCLSLQDVYSIWLISPKERTSIENLVKERIANGL